MRSLPVEGKDFAIEDVVEDDLFLVTVADGRDPDHGRSRGSGRHHYL